MKPPWRSSAATALDPLAPPTGEAPRILFPFLATALSRSALDASLRLARAEGAVLVPVFLAPVPRWLPLDCPLPRQAEMAVATQEAIEQRAASFGVAVDARLERGRTARHALQRAIDCERYQRIVVAAAALGAHGFAPDDVAWLLLHAPGEIVVLRPGREDDLLEIEPEEVPDTRGPTVAMPAAFS
ncbi:MAG TPA: universal stress protein [Solirubrobacteraceae bacterium]|nr:universal stress protein [Solirubrobacteraceae bacterium]